MKTGTNLDFANTLRLERQPEPPRDEYLAATWDMIYSKIATQPITWFDRFASRMAHRILALILRDAHFRRRLCLALAAEMRSVDEWLDRPTTPPPAPHKD